MKVYIVPDPLQAAIEYARTSSHHAQGVMLSRVGDTIIVKHLGGHSRGFRREDLSISLNRIMNSFEVEGFDTKGGKR